MKTTNCPACGGTIRIYSDHEPGDEVHCDDCERKFQLIATDPVRLDDYERYEDDEYFDSRSFDDNCSDF
ncbi:MAG: hypothetical protein D3916_01830 [Candidatus Electrothrix sp. MAN1_4]|nr:hypothetical protein [Candidatus Electrothrix sp. MAN1_4]